MPETWRLGTDDEAELELSCSKVVLDHVSTGEVVPFGLATLTVLAGPLAATVGDLTPDDLRRLANALTTFAEVIERRADPGDELGVCVRCGNAGELQEHHEGLGVCGGCKGSN